MVYRNADCAHTYLDDGMDDLRGIITEVQSVAQPFNGL